ncbi:uncharacterized protein BJ171DRAFT_523300 [Polychytrium aggregatum]|uniref:uncharacterized protein n=1 Tax=Polychytrium aggregatum TaxID=110093 RepID=UPI0022FEEEED|nr:uncharacterized protein BJ171DRAFT_544450 [Polychytrium aggregatum]XP_052962748.1 uncharacterized protein BJ171DRAFT_523300 [Polychytrium aggregatum]KAI9190558.1 hypothetical protein BJ171DRAFT_544450 [Polychytrium aggregatum]KAI9197091.1 hypothetical protein BJ171DRAFT_523300 [Polychytrium aggregatum]
MTMYSWIQMVTRKERGISIFKDGDRRTPEGLDFAREKTRLLISDIRARFSSGDQLPFDLRFIETLRSLLDHTSGELADGDLFLTEEQVMALHSAVVTLYRDELSDDEDDVSRFLQYTKSSIVNGVSPGKRQESAATPTGSSSRLFARRSTPRRLKRKSPPHQSPELATEDTRSSPSPPTQVRRRLPSPEVAAEVVIETTEQANTPTNIEDPMMMLKRRNLELQNELLLERIETERALRQERIAAIRRGDARTSSH